MQGVLSFAFAVARGRHVQVLDPLAVDGIAPICLSENDDKRDVARLKILLCHQGTGDMAPKLQ
jgi:hypothetical protein